MWSKSLSSLSLTPSTRVISQSKATINIAGQQSPYIYGATSGIRSTVWPKHEFTEWKTWRIITPSHHGWMSVCLSLCLVHISVRLSFSLFSSVCLYLWNSISPPLQLSKRSLVCHSVCLSVCLYVSPPPSLFFSKHVVFRVLQTFFWGRLNCNLISYFGKRRPQCKKC